MKGTQQGITVIGMLLTLAVVVILGVFIMRVVPIYLQNYEIKHSIRALSSLPAENFSSNTQANIHVLRGKMMNQLYISGVDMIKREDVKIEAISRTDYRVSVQYEAKRTLFSNVSIVIEFDIKEEVQIDGS